MQIAPQRRKKKEVLKVLNCTNSDAPLANIAQQKKLANVHSFKSAALSLTPEPKTNEKGFPRAQRASWGLILVGG